MNQTQTRIMQYLKSHPGASASVISQALGMTTANIRYHLTSLEEAHLVEVEVSTLTKGRGHPVHLYHLNIYAQPHNLDCLADILMSEFIDEANPEINYSQAVTMADRLIRKGRNLTEARLKPNRLTQSLTQVAQSLDQFHYQARWEAHTGSPQFIFGECPYRAIVDRHPILCLMDALLLKKLLSRPVKQTARIGQGAPLSTSCIFEVELHHSTNS
jgi:predicted ArsR family transcriptional regulator